MTDKPQTQPTVTCVILPPHFLPVPVREMTLDQARAAIEILAQELTQMQAARFRRHSGAGNQTDCKCLT